MPAASKAHSVAREAVNYVLDKGISGVPPLSSAANLAGEYLLDRSFGSNDARVNSLIRWETSKNFTSGFLTGLGGLITLPITIPAALGASWVVQARMAGAIAKIYGHNLEDDRVRTFVLLSLAGDSAAAVVKDAGVQIGRKLTEKAIMAIPGRVLVEINKQVGFRLITKAGERGIVNLIKVVPVAGGVVGGSMDALSCRLVGRTAKMLFGRE